MDNEIEKRFTSLPPELLSQQQLTDLSQLSEAAKTYSEALRLWCPPGRERAMAETNAEQAAMWASKSVTHTPRKG